MPRGEPAQVVALADRGKGSAAIKGHVKRAVSEWVGVNCMEAFGLLDVYMYNLQGRRPARAQRRASVPSRSLAAITPIHPLLNT